MVESRRELLIDLSREVSSRVPLDPTSVRRLQSAMDALSATDFALETRHRLWFWMDWSCQCLHRDDRVNISLFYLPRRRIIPLHDHPQMVVFQRVLADSFEVRSLAWEEGGPRAGLARLDGDRVIHAGEGTSIIDPTTPNLHSVRALESGVFLDVVIPPYDVAAGRICRYYQETGTIQSDSGPRIRVMEVAR